MNATLCKIKVKVKWRNLNFPNINGHNIYEIEQGKELELINFLNSTSPDFKYVLEDWNHVKFEIVKSERSMKGKVHF